MVLGLIRRLWRTENRPSRGGMLIKMIELRKRKDPRLRRERLANWTMGHLWGSPEGAMLDLVEDYLWLEDAGLSERLALEQLERVNCGIGVLPELSRGALIEEVLRSRDREPVLDKEVLRAQLLLAYEWAEEEVKRTKSQPPVSREVLRKRIRIEDVAQRERRLNEWARIEARMTEHDELWRYGGSHRSGIVLIRDGRAIATVTTAVV
jgi:hypothetical protein